MHSDTMWVYTQTHHWLRDGIVELHVPKFNSCVCLCESVFLHVFFSPSMPRARFAWYHPARAGTHMDRNQIQRRDITRALDVTGTSEAALFIICCEVSPSTMTSLHLLGHAG